MGDISCVGDDEPDTSTKGFFWVVRSGIPGKKEAGESKDPAEVSFIPNPRRCWYSFLENLLESLDIKCEFVPAKESEKEDLISVDREAKGDRREDC